MTTAEKIMKALYDAAGADGTLMTWDPNPARRFQSQYEDLELPDNQEDDE